MTRLASMRRFFSFGAALALGAALAVTVSSCGGGGDATLSSANADQLLEFLDDIESKADAGECDAAADSAGQVADELSTVSTDMDPKLKSALIDGFERIQALAADPATCSSVDTTTEEDTTEEEPTRTRETTTTEEVPTTAPEPPEPTPTQSTQPTTPTAPSTGGTGGGPGL